MKDVLDERLSYVNAKKRREAMVAGENNLAEQLQAAGRQGKLLERGRDHLNMADDRDSKESNSLGDAITVETGKGKERNLTLQSLEGTRGGKGAAIVRRGGFSNYVWRPIETPGGGAEG